MKECLDEFKLLVKKVELPRFFGTDPFRWILRAETYFEVHNTYDAMRIKLTRLCMEGSTIHWFNLWREDEGNPTWENLKKALMRRYGGTHYDNPFEALKVLQQFGTVEEYIETFEFVSSQVSKLPKQ